LTRLLRQENAPIPTALFASGARAPRFRLGHVPPAEPTEEDFLRDLDLLEGIPSEVRRNRDLLRVVLPALLADTALYRGYVYREEPPLDCPIFAYGGGADPNVLPEHLDAWRHETTGGFSLRFFPGGHFFIDSASPAFLAALSEDLRRG
jgi:medium-chain acyl-[acyl-carrier-protein] hydrolase